MQYTEAPVPEFPNYIINTNGDVFSLHDQKGVRTNRKKLKPQPAGIKYLTVRLYSNGKNKKLLIHRLVAQAFIDNPDNKPQINHIDGDKHNNNVCNLEWCDNSENQIHARNNNLTHTKLSKTLVRQIRSEHKLGKCTHKELSKKYNVTAANITMIVTNQRWKESTL